MNRRPISSIQQIAPSLFAECPFLPGDVIWGYLRYSTGDQNIDSQLHAIEEWCRMHGLVLARTFRDEARSGTTTAGRDDFMRMIELMRSPQLLPNPRPRGIVFWSLARFARDFDDSQYFKSDLRRRGYVLHSMTDAIPQGPIGRVVESIHDYKNEAMVEQMRIEVRRALYDLAAQGYATGGFPPRGYKRGAPISLGRKKNGEERVAHRWEIDERYEDQVRTAWQMRLQGHGHWDIHKATKLFKTIGCYATFFTNITYAGFRKCGTAQFADAHPAYVSKEEFDRVQAMRRTLPANAKAPEGDAHHSRRLHSSDPLSGLVYCTCGAMIVQRSDNGRPFYQCGRQQRQGRDVCGMPTLVAWYMREVLYGWLCANTLTVDALARAREATERLLSGDQSELQARKNRLEADRVRIDRAARNLYDTVEVTGLTDELRRRLRERTLEVQETEAELAQVNQMLRQQHLRIGDDVLVLLSSQMTERLKNGNPDEVRSVLRHILIRVELDRTEMRLDYALPLISAMACINEVPPRMYSPNASHLLIQPRFTLTFERPPIGRASPMYERSK